MIENKSRSPIEDGELEDPFWENLYDKFPGLEELVELGEYDCSNNPIESAIEYALEEGRKRGVAQ